MNKNDNRLIHIAGLGAILLFSLFLVSCINNMFTHIPTMDATKVVAIKQQKINNWKFVRFDGPNNGPFEAVFRWDKPTDFGLSDRGKPGKFAGYRFILEENRPDGSIVHLTPVTSPSVVTLADTEVRFLNLKAGTNYNFGIILDTTFNY